MRWVNTISKGDTIVEVYTHDTGLVIRVCAEYPPDEQATSPDDPGCVLLDVNYLGWALDDLDETNADWLTHWVHNSSGAEGWCGVKGCVFNECPEHEAASLNTRLRAAIGSPEARAELIEFGQAHLLDGSFRLVRKGFVPRRAREPSGGHFTVEIRLMKMGDLSKGERSELILSRAGNSHDEGVAIDRAIAAIKAEASR